LLAGFSDINALDPDALDFARKALPHVMSEFMQVPGIVDFQYDQIYRMCKQSIDVSELL